MVTALAKRPSIPKPKKNQQKNFKPTLATLVNGTQAVMVAFNYRLT